MYVVLGDDARRGVLPERSPAHGDMGVALRVNKWRPRQWRACGELRRTVDLFLVAVDLLEERARREREKLADTAALENGLLGYIRGSTIPVRLVRAG